VTIFLNEMKDGSASHSENEGLAVVKDQLILNKLKSISKANNLEEPFIMGTFIDNGESFLQESNV